MRRLLGTFALSAAVAVGTAAPVLAQAPSPVCDAYSGNCVGGTKSERPAVRPSRGGSSLPLTGGDVVLLLVAGGGAVAGGTALVAAGRKRRSAS
jgi:LPXTG-motif cell wall-anchored protein